MRKLFTLLTTLALLCVVSCEEQGDDNVNPNEKPTGERIASVEEQMEAIAESLPELKAAASALDNLVSALSPSNVALAAHANNSDKSNNGVKDQIAELEERIEELEEFIANGGTNKEWLDATYATLEMYEETIALLTALQAEVDALKEHISGSTYDLFAEVDDKIESSCESMKEWINEQLSGYYDIAEVDALLSQLEASLTEESAELLTSIEELRESLQHSLGEMREEYKAAIAEAIGEYDGVITEKIAGEIEAVNERIDSEIAALNKRLDDIEARLEELENAVTNLINRIQSITYVPTHDDGKARVDCHNASIEGSTMTMDFIISPKSAVADIAERFEEILTLKANFVGTTDFVSLPITSCTADAENGVLTISMTCDNLGEDFFYMRKNARVMLTISDGNNDRNTEYIALYPRYHKLADNMIVYTSTDGSPIDIEQQWKDIALNIYNGEIGLLISDNAITHIPYTAFLNCTSLASVIIPDSVTEIGESAFNGCTSLRSITIPNSVTSIGVGAFYGCKRLMSLTIPESVISIGRWAFSYGGMGELVINSKIIETNYDFDDGIFVDSGFTSIVIGDNVTRIGSYAFKRCLSLASITIPNSVTEIGERVFSGCTSLRSITIPNSVTSLAEGAFADCPSLAEFNGKFASEDRRCLIIDRHLTKYAPAAELTEYTIPEGVTSIGNSAFSGCTSLTSVTIPEGVTSIGSWAFYGCPSLTSVTIPDSVTSIGGLAFYGCTSLTSFCGKFASEDGRCLILGATLYHFAPAGLTEYTIPDSVTSIGDMAFADCSSLTSITIPDSVTWIGNSAFWACTSLTSVTIGNGVTSIGDGAFASCFSLTSVYCKATTPPTGGSDMFYDNASGRKIYVPTESVEEYKAAEGWSEYRYSIVGYDFE
ncbi:MAG: leucine-rich repeat protein [Tidjanibacter sp.]|nr:leucine-rich repeat protein [Tidjanibacter sp.]MBQ8272886.1 leucine-rich repeat protein [Tidjanibacter sp.]